MSILYGSRLVHTPALVVLIVGLLPSLANAQSASEMPVAPTVATPLPLSGRPLQSGQVSVTQRTAVSGSSDSVVVLDSTINVPAPFNGSAASGAVTALPVTLTLEAALAMGLRANLGALSESAAVQQAQGRQTVARSTLLPQLNTVVSEAFEKINIRTLGVSESSFPLSSKFNYYDARAARLNQSVFDLVRIRNLQSSSQEFQASLRQARNARDLIVLAVGGSFLQIVSTEARAQAAAANVTSFRAIFQQASDRLEAGLATRVDVTRSQVQMQTQQQRLRSLQADVETQKLRLARIVGLPLGQAYNVAGAYSFSPLSDVTLEQALSTAQTGRTDLQAAALSVQSAETALRAAHSERLPSVQVNADFGAAGITPTHKSVGVYNVSGTLTIPLYEGGRIRGEAEQATAALRQRQAELADLRGQVDQDVRQAFIDLNAAADQVGVAQSNVVLAHETLTQSRDRFVAGVADTVELVQAEQSVVQADDDAITAVFDHNLAKVSLARALGNAEQTLPQFLRK